MVCIFEPCKFCVHDFASVLYLLLARKILGLPMSEEVRYYKGKHKVKVVTESAGYWIVEALEEFNDFVDDDEVTVKVGERRIVPSSTVYKHQSIPLPIREHVYELKMEKKLKQLVAKEEKKQSEKETP
jgi:hypothetical protein